MKVSDQLHTTTTLPLWRVVGLQGKSVCCKEENNLFCVKNRITIPQKLAHSLVSMPTELCFSVRRMQGPINVTTFYYVRSIELICFHIFLYDVRITSAPFLAQYNCLGRTYRSHMVFTKLRKYHAVF
jgi:hypothetical protein